MTATNEAEVRGWFAGRLPQDWTLQSPQVTVDREEITVLVTLAAPETGPDAGEVERESAAAGRAKAWREQTREERMRLADEAEHRFARKLAWGVVIETRRELFTHLAVAEVPALKQAGIVDKGMIPKVDSAVTAVRAGVEKVQFIDGRVPHSLLLEIFTDAGVGTELVA